MFNAVDCNTYPTRRNAHPAVVVAWVQAKIDQGLIDPDGEACYVRVDIIEVLSQETVARRSSLARRLGSLSVEDFYIDTEDAEEDNWESWTNDIADELTPIALSLEAN